MDSRQADRRRSDPIGWFREHATSLSSQEEEILTILSIVGPLNVSMLADFAALAGIRETPARAHSTKTLGAMLRSLTERGFVHSDLRHGYSCGPSLRSVVARFAAGRSMQRLLTAIRRIERSDYLDAWVAPFLDPTTALGPLRRLGETSPHTLDNVARDLLCHPFDASWFAGLPEALRDLLLERALVEAERVGFDARDLFAFVKSHPESVARSFAALSAFAGIAVLRGDLEALRVLCEPGAAGPWRSTIATALAMVEGRYADAAREAERSEAKLDKSAHTGIVLLLHAVALRRSRSPQSLDALRKLVLLGKRKGTSFESAWKAFEYLLARDAAGTSARPPTLYKSETDCVTCLLEAWAASLSEKEDDAVEALVWMSRQLDAHVPHFARVGLVWLSQQYHFATLALLERQAHRPAPLRMRIEVPPEVEGAIGPSIFGAIARREPWEIALERLEALARTSSPTSASVTVESERLFWRTVGEGTNKTVEPYVQKRATGTGSWTSGRKLALKHLVGDRGFVSSLPMEDQRVAKHAFAERAFSHGYGETYYSMGEGVWLALVGHPRVFVGLSATPSEVVLGVPKIAVRSQAEGLRVELTPKGLRSGVQVHEEGGRLVVYSTTTEAAPLLAAVGAGLTFPLSARAQCLAALDKLAHLFPIDSTEESTARLVPSDPTPYFRLVPSQNGLSVSLLVRPLGPTGPHAEPADGATTLVGAVGGETVRAERDFEAEERAATEALLACPSLAGSETGDYAWVLREPAESLELVAALRALGDAVAVEWPHGTPLKLRSRVGRSAFTGGVRREGGWLEVDARLAVDADLTVELEELLRLLTESPGRFLRLGQGEYVELEAELREVLEVLATARAERKDRGGVSVPLGAVSVFRKLGSPESGLSLDGSASEHWERVEAAFAKRFGVPRGLRAELRDYQVEGFRWLARLSELELGACLADDMGLGKTVQLIALLLHRAKSGPALVVAPTSVCDNWQKEIERFGPSLRTRNYWGPEREGTLVGLRGRDVVLTSYAILQQDATLLGAVEWGTAILDEAQLIKNAQTLRAKAAFGLRAAMRIAATGTPVENRAGDLHSIFQFLNPGLLGSPQAFAQRMATSDSASSRATRSLIEPFVLRRTKSEVLADLPPLTEIQRTVTLSPPEAALYEAVRKGALAKLGAAVKEPGARIQVLAELTRLRRLCCHPELAVRGSNLGSSKLESFLELAKELALGGHRMLVFSQFTDVLALARTLLDEHGITYQYLDGSTPQKERAAAVEAFQEGRGDAFLISLKAGGFGLNLTAADYVIHLDPWWNPAVEAQASDRAHRIGQTRPVTVYRLVTEGTIEARIVALHKEKRELADSILEGTDRAAQLSSEDLRSLLEGSLSVGPSAEVRPPVAVSSIGERAGKPTRERAKRPAAEVAKQETVEGALSLEAYADVVAKIMRGDERASVLRAAGHTEVTFAAAQSAWTLELQADKALAKRFVSLLALRR